MNYIADTIANAKTDIRKKDLKTKTSILKTDQNMTCSQITQSADHAKSQATLVLIENEVKHLKIENHNRKLELNRTVFKKNYVVGLKRLA